MVKEAIVLRLGHRITRDVRITTHCALVARAFMAKKIIIAGERNDQILSGINSVSKKWGGNFEIEFSEDWKKEISEHKKNKFVLVHLTMYGLPLKKTIKKIKKEEKLLIIIGAEKVPKKVYEESDFNVSISNQPHSEVAALAVFLHELFGGKELEKQFSNPKIKVIGSKKGKTVLKEKN